MEEIIFVTHNKGKIISAKKALKNVNFKILEYDLEEPRSEDIKYISDYDGKELQQFMGKHEGSIATKMLGKDVKEKWSDLWYIYIPKNETKTLAQMTEEERETRRKRKIDESQESLEVFAKWYLERKVK